MFINDDEAASRIGVRVNRLPILWPQVQRKEPGVYDWEKYDRLIQERLDARIGGDSRSASDVRAGKDARWGQVDLLRRALRGRVYPRVW